MPITVLQHSDSAVGGPGRLGATLRDHGFKLDIRRPDLRGEAAIPHDLDDVQGVVIMGGPMNVTDIASLPWMQREAAFIKAAHDAQLPVIGICLGAQLIAHALGGQVGPKDAGPELGFRPTTITIQGQTETMLSGIAWHAPWLYSCGQEVRTLPPGATALATTPSTKIAAFRAGLRTYGYLFHFECDRPQTDALLAASRDFAQKLGKSEGDLRAEADRDYPTFARLSDRLTVNLATYCFPIVKKMSA